MHHNWVIVSLFLGACVISSALATTPKKISNQQAEKKFRILGVFSHPGKSHFDVFRPLLEELGSRGHEITVVSYFPRDNRTRPLPNYRDISLVTKNNDVFVDVVDLRMVQHNTLRLLQELMILRFWAIESCEYGLDNPEVRALINSKNEVFDLIITEGFNSDCFLGFVHRFKAPFISLSSHQLMPWVNSRFANDDNPSYVPCSFMGFSPHMTFFERVKNALAVPFIKLAYEFGTDMAVQKLVERAFGPGVPALKEIARNTSAVLVNTHYSLFGPKPHVPGVVEIGGIHISNEVQKLPPDVQSFLDEAREGVLYFSLGSMIKASTMPEDKLKMFLKVIREIPRKVIWKWEAEDMKDKPKNLMVKKWLQQAAILRHPNVKCYMAHGGLLGLSEGVQAGVPMVMIPMYGDQFHNSAAARSRGVAEILNWGDITEGSLRTALDKIFNDTRYGENARALAKAYLDRPETPLQTAVWWTEYIARGNGNRYLRSAGQDLAWYQYYLLDVVLFVALVGFLFGYASYRLLGLLAGWFRRGKVTGGSNRAARKKMDKRE